MQVLSSLRSAKTATRIAKVVRRRGRIYGSVKQSAIQSGTGT